MAAMFRGRPCLCEVFLTVLSVYRSKTCFEPCNRRVEFIGQVVHRRVLRLKLGVCGTRFET